MNAPTILRKLDGRTNVVVEERPLTISRTDFIEAIEVLWPAARFEYNDELVRVSVWPTIASSLLTRPRYIFELT